MWRFLAIVSVAMVVFFSYLAWSLADSVVGGVLLALPFLAILSFPAVVMILGRDRQSPLRDVISYFAFFSMGFLTYLFLFSVLRDGLRFGAGVEVSPVWVFAATGFALLVGGLRAAIGPRVREITVPVPLAALDGFRVVQISDLHIGLTIGPRYVKRVVAMTKTLNADLVALTGDIGDGESSLLSEAIEPLADLAPAGRVYYVPGNHEYYWSVEKWIAAFQKVGMRSLVNTGERLRVKNVNLLVAGVPDSMASPDVKAAYDAGPQCDYKILLAHRPDQAADAEAAGFDLQLSGHTHGGQFFPWTLVGRMVHKFNQGLHRTGNMWIYVSPGTGSWGPLLRLGTTPELTLLRFKFTPAATH